MPFKDKDKKQAYYNNHKKHYDRDWKKKNREKWNKYQAEYKRKKKIQNNLFIPSKSYYDKCRD